MSKQFQYSRDNGATWDWSAADGVISYAPGPVQIRWFGKAIPTPASQPPPTGKSPAPSTTARSTNGTVFVQSEFSSAISEPLREAAEPTPVKVWDHMTDEMRAGALGDGPAVDCTLAFQAAINAGIPKRKWSKEADLLKSLSNPAERKPVAAAISYWTGPTNAAGFPLEDCASPRGWSEYEPTTLKHGQAIAERQDADKRVKWLYDSPQ